jgi:2-dehydro-3-deoxyphosphogluconate aldolase/(4S)-4-hydroxy-2-oxoglutarate aldolase
MVTVDLADFRVIPVVVIKDANRAEPLSEALARAGVPVAEVTLRTGAAIEAIRGMAANSAVTVGAGTVLTAAQVDQAVTAGARFIVSPGFRPEVVGRAQWHGVSVYPGAVTPTEVMTAMEAGLEIVKFFPADVFGGPSALKALGAPFPEMRFIPTGGVSAENVDDYLALPNVAAVGGSWMVPAAAIDAGDFAAIERLCRAVGSRSSAGTTVVRA